MIVVCFGLIAGVVIWWIVSSFVSPLSRFPHFRGWPIFGNLFQINQDRAELILTEWKERLGEAFSVKLLWQHVLVLNSYDTIYEALVRNGGAFAGRPHKTGFWKNLFSASSEDIVNSNPDPRWDLLKETVHNSIKMYNSGMQQIEAIAKKSADDLMKKFQQAGGEPFDPREMVKTTMMNVITAILIEEASDENEELLEFISETEDLTVKSLTTTGREQDLFPLLRFVCNTAYKDLVIENRKHSKLWELIKEKALGSHKGVVGALFKEFQCNTLEKLTERGMKLTEDHLRLTALNMITAGTVTTSNTFHAYLNIISQHPRIQRNLQEEVKRVVGQGRNVALSDRSNMPYASATLYELLRYSSIVPLGIPQCTINKTSMCGQLVPEGTIVVTNLWALHHDEEFWPTPFSFLPERFLNEDGTLVSASHKNRLHLMPFGAGPRGCVGEILVLNLLFLLIATTAQKFDIKQGPQRVACNPMDYDAGAVLSSKSFEICAITRGV